LQKFNKKSKEENNYKHNRSFEQNSINNDILLQYKIESPLVPGISDNCGNEIIEILNLNGNGNKNSNKIKKIKNKNLNNSYILQSKFKNIITENINNNPENKNVKDNNNISNSKGNKNNIYRNNINSNINKNKD
jgi:hypothetical protein